jgi:hypothetical protein
MISYITIGVLALVVGLETWWIIKSVQKFLIIKQLFKDVYDDIDSYAEHVKYVHGLELYYGDETLKALIEHGDSTRLSVEEFLEIFSEFEDLEQISLPEPDTEEELAADDDEAEA